LAPEVPTGLAPRRGGASDRSAKKAASPLERSTVQGTSYLPSCFFRHKSSWRNHAWVVISQIERIELRPQDVTFESQSIERRALRLGRAGVPLHIIQGVVGVARRLGQPALEILHHVVADEVVILQHARDALSMNLRRE